MNGKYSQQPPARVTTRLVAPPGACDCHGHIFPSATLYPTAKDAMPLAPVEMFLSVHAQIGMTRNVLVQGGAYRFDNRAMLEALDLHPDTLRGVALVPPDIADADLAALSARRVRALRFTTGGASRIDALPTIAPRMRAHALHAEMFIGLPAIAARASDLLATGLPLVFDHLAGPFDPGIGLNHPDFRALLGLLDTGQTWVKLTPARNSRDFPDYSDVRPFHDALIAARPDRLVWGSDWPFPNMSDATPVLGDLATQFGDWVTDAALRRMILTDNPAVLYGFPPITDAP